VDVGWSAVRTRSLYGRGTPGRICFVWVGRPRWRSTA